MSRIFEHDHAEDYEVVSRTLAQVHKAIDTHFPHVGAANSRKFASTEFSINEKTLSEKPGEHPDRLEPSISAETQDSVPVTAGKQKVAGNADTASADHSLAAFTSLESRPPSQFTNIEDTLSGDEGAFSMDEAELLATDPNFHAVKKSNVGRIILLSLVLAVLAAYYFYGDLALQWLP